MTLGITGLISLLMFPTLPHWINASQFSPLFISLVSVQHVWPNKSYWEPSFFLELSLQSWQTKLASFCGEEKLNGPLKLLESIILSYISSPAIGCFLPLFGETENGCLYSMGLMTLTPTHSCWRLPEICKWVHLRHYWCSGKEFLLIISH